MKNQLFDLKPLRSLSDGIKEERRERNFPPFLMKIYSAQLKYTRRQLLIAPREPFSDKLSIPIFKPGISLEKYQIYHTSNNIKLKHKESNRVKKFRV